MVYSDAAPPFAAGFFVYRLWSATGVCLYVGAAGTLASRPVALAERLRNHSRYAVWAPDVVAYDWEQLVSAEAARAEERTQILALNPVHNVAHNRSRPPRASQPRHAVLCHQGLHDVTVPGSRETNGACKECTRTRRQRHRAANRAQRVAYLARYREKIGEEEYLRRDRQYARSSRSRKKNAA
jgi:hypothetical protein